jgi:signal transduction histidine kinase
LSDPRRSVARARWHNARAPILLLVCAVIPIVILCGVFGYYFTLAQRDNLDHDIRDRAERLSSALAQQLTTQVQLLTILSESPRLDPPLQKAEFARIGERLRQRVPSWQMLRITSADGSVELTVPPSKTDGSGQKVVDTASHAELVRTGKPTIGSIALGPRGLPAFPVRVAVIRDGKVVYGLTSVIRPSALEAVIEKNGLPRDWVGWIADGTGKLVVSTFTDVASLARPAADAVTLDLQKDADLQTGDLKDGRAVRVAAVPVEGTDWTIYVGMPANAYAATVSSGLYLLVATALVTVLLSCVAAFLFLRELAARRRDEAAVASWQRVDALGKLTGGLAHDFNNLLMVFQSASESIRRRPDDLNRVNRILDGMAEAVTRGKTLTQRLLSFSRRSNQDAVTTDIADHLPLLQDSLGQASQELVALEFDFAAGLWPTRIDPQSLETALINLVTNAREAMPHGGTVTIAARNVADLFAETKKLKGQGVALSVADEGPGIAGDDVNRIYEPFFTTKEGATGLGLSQVAAFAQRSGGMVTVSGGGRGTMFTIYLPRDLTAEESPVSASIGQAPASSVPAGEVMPATVLVVDDTPSSLTVARMTLEDAGVRTYSAASGGAAITVLNGAKVGGVLSDIRMPGMSGLELLDHVRSRYPGIPMVLMTGFSEVIEQGHRVDVPVLTKPFTSEQLKSAFAQAASRLG